MRRLSLLGILLLAGLGSGCATIIHGTTQEIPVTSEPPGATVTTGDLKATTPGKLELKRKTPDVLTVSKEGYKAETVKLQSVLSGAVAGNIIAGGLIGWGVDAASGGDSRLVPESVHVVLKPHDPVQVVLTGPPGAEVRINEQRYVLDLTGVLALTLRPGSYPVAMSKRGFEPWADTLVVEPEKPLRREATLTPIKGGAEAAPPTPPAPAAPATGGQAPTDDPKSLESRLQTLKELREKNLITEEQYQTATSELLKKLTQ